MAIPAAPAGAAVDSTSIASVRDAYLNTYLPALNVAPGWTGDAASCTPGVTSADARTAELTVINYFRALAGLQPTTEDTAATAKAQQAALMMTANHDLSHTPPATWKCYTADGAGAAGSSNLGLGHPTGGQAIADYMDDSLTDSVGHRAWVLQPDQSAYGLGMTADANALMTFGDPSMRNNTAPSGATPWPSRGYFPHENLPNLYWSYSQIGVSFAGATVTVAKNGVALTTADVHAEGVIDGWPAPRLVWSMPTLPRPAVGTSDTYHVTISGPLTDAYDVEIFNAVEASVDPTTGGSTAGTQGPTATPTSTADSSADPAPAQSTSAASSRAGTPSPSASAVRSVSAVPSVSTVPSASAAPTAVMADTGGASASFAPAGLAIGAAMIMAAAIIVIWRRLLIMR
jgi:uncharacterized protein YkwD